MEPGSTLPWQTVIVLRNRPFMALVIGQFVSQLGNAAYSVALPWAVYQATGDFLALGSVASILTVTRLALGWWGGVVADRVSRKTLIAMADVGRGVAVCLTALLFWHGVVSLWPLLVLAVCFGIGESLFNPAYFGLIPLLVPQSELRRANAIASGLRATTSIVGPLVGGLLVATVGAAGVFLANGLSFFVGAFALILVPTIKPLGEPRKDSVLRNARDGIRHLYRARVLWAPVLIALISTPLSDAPWSILLPRLLNALSDQGEAAYGATLSAFGWGVIAGSFLAGGHLPGTPHSLFFVATAAGGAAQIALGLAGTVQQVVGAAVAIGVTVGLARVHWPTLLQLAVSAEYLGRVQGLTDMAAVAVLPLGYAGTAYLAERAGTPGIFVASVMLIVLAVLVVPWVFPVRKGEENNGLQA